jgi:hypothetical protein
LRRAATSPQLHDAHPLVVRRRTLDSQLERLGELDRDLVSVATERAALVEEILALADTLWPTTALMAGRQPPSADDLPLPEIPAGAGYILGRQLRSACLYLLRFHGPLALPELHRLLHLNSLAVASKFPAKCLANALALEVAKGRAVRVRRGVYDVDPRWRPRPGRHGAIPLVGPPWGIPADLADLVVQVPARAQPQDP